MPGAQSIVANCGVDFSWAKYGSRAALVSKNCKNSSRSFWSALPKEGSFNRTGGPGQPPTPFRLP
jgi:hypothetical protein